jgi:hypothetical protein
MRNPAIWNDSAGRIDNGDIPLATNDPRRKIRQ